MINYDVVLKHIGGFGSFQLMLVVMIFYYSITFGINSIAPVFMNYRPYHRCNVPPIDNSSLYPDLTEQDILNLTAPLIPETDTYNICFRYGYNLSECYNGIEQCVNKSATPIPCDMGYHYDTSEFPRTVITEFDLICDKFSYDFYANIIYTIGTSVATNIFTLFSDRFGRKAVMLSCCIIEFGALLGCTWANTYLAFFICRFLITVFGFGNFLTSFIYLIEVVSKKWRTPIGISYQMFFAIGYMILSGFSFLLRDWHKLNLATSLIVLPYTVCLLFIPDPPRWLFARDENEKGKQVTQNYAKFNKVSLNESLIWMEAEKATAEKEKETQQKYRTQTYTLINLLKTRNIRIITLKLWFCWFINNLVYYGLTLSAGVLSNDVFANNALSGLVEVASYVIVILLMDRIGRRLMLTSMLCLAALGLMCAAIVGEYATSNTIKSLKIAFTYVAVVGIAGSNAVNYNFTAELYPTVVRSMGLGWASTSGRLGRILSPFIIALQASFSWLPNVIFCISSLLTAGLALTLPDTSKISLTDTIEEAEDFYRGDEVKTFNKDSSIRITEDNAGTNNEVYENEFYSQL